MSASLRRTFAEAVEPVLDFMFPPRCLACGAAVGRQGGLCGDCWAGLAIPGEPCCAVCQRPLAQDGEGAWCIPCLASPPRHAGIHAATLYTPVSRKLILAFKHGRRIAMAPMLARLIAARLPADSRTFTIVPVPLHRWRLWRRGYNQAALLARELARLGHGELVVDALDRTRRTPSLGGLGRQARRKALRGAIAVGDPRREAIRGRDVLLVDDVLTSGATTDVCVRALLRAGARSVRIACFARVLDSPSPGSQANETPGTAGVPGAA